MSEDVNVLRLNDFEYAAEVHQGNEFTEHRVVYSQATLDELLVPDVDHRDFVVESVKYLLQDTPGTALPHDIDLGELQGRDPDFIPEVRARLGE